MNNLVIIGHPDKNSFCHNGIFRTISKILNDHPNQELQIVDLYEDKLHRDKKELIKQYKDYVTWSDRIYFISPVWWFRLTPKMETFFDEVFTPGFAYAVSYTHLRAHETEADLVCRLLLEKKNPCGQLARLHP